MSILDLEERRIAPRFEVALPGQLTTEANHLVEMVVSNISSSGVQLEMPQREMPHLLPNDHSQNTMSPVGVKLSIDLQDQLDTIHIRCGVVYVQRKSHSHCIVGCRFEKFYDNAGPRLESFIANQR